MQKTENGKFLLNYIELKALVEGSIEKATKIINDPLYEPNYDGLPYYTNRAYQLLTGQSLFTENQLNGIKMISTTELCKKLEVSRDWVNRHLRHFGSVQIVDNGIRVVLYDEKEVIDYLNSIATFSRQTVKLDLSQFANADELEEWDLQLQKLHSKPKKTLNDFEKIEEIYSEFLKKVLPENLFAQYQLVDARNRGLLPWVAVEYQIHSLDELQSIKQLQGKKSTELAYREIYKQAMIRVEIFGRRFYMTDMSKCKYPLLMPANYI